MYVKAWTYIIYIIYIHVASKVVLQFQKSKSTSCQQLVVHNGVGGIGGYTAVVVPVAGHLDVALCAPVGTPAVGVCVCVCVCVCVRV